MHVGRVFRFPIWLLGFESLYPLQESRGINSVAERLFYTQNVGGSNPSSRTKNNVFSVGCSVGMTQ